MPPIAERALPRYADQILQGESAGLSNHVLLTSDLDANDSEAVDLRPRPRNPGIGTHLLAVFHRFGGAARRAHDEVVRHERSCAMAARFRSTISAIFECRDAASDRGKTVPLRSRCVARMPAEGGLLTVGEAARLVRRARLHIASSNEEILATQGVARGDPTLRLQDWMLPSMRVRWNDETTEAHDFFLAATLDAARAAPGFASKMLAPSDVDRAFANAAALYEALREALPDAQLDAPCLEGIVLRGRELKEQSANLVADVQAHLVERASARAAATTVLRTWDEGVRVALEQRQDLNIDARHAFRELAAALPLPPILVEPCLQMVDEATEELSRFAEAARARVPPDAEVCARARTAVDRGLAAVAAIASAAGVAFDPSANTAWACELCARVACAREGLADMGEADLRLQRHFLQNVLGMPATA